MRLRNLLMAPIILALAVPACAAAAAAKHDWALVGQIPRTQKVIVHYRDGKTISGVIQDVGAEGLTLLRRKKPVEVRRTEIEAVTRRSRLKGALWGAAAGGGIGAAIGAGKAVDLLDKNNPTVQDRAAAGLVIGGLFGGIGAAIGVATGTEQTLYQAEKPVKAKRSQ